MNDDKSGYFVTR